jgi:hypothetical protein
MLMHLMYSATKLGSGLYPILGSVCAGVILLGLTAVIPV